MVRTKTVARKAGGGTVSGGFPTPTQPVLTQDVEAEVARATEAAQHVARLRAMLDGDGSEDGDDDEAVVVSSRPNAPKAKRSRSQTKGNEAVVVSSRPNAPKAKCGHSPCHALPLSHGPWLVLRPTSICTRHRPPAHCTHRLCIQTGSANAEVPTSQL